MDDVIRPDERIPQHVTRSLQYHVIQAWYDSALDHAGRPSDQRRGSQTLQGGCPLLGTQVVAEDDPIPLAAADRLEDVLVSQRRRAPGELEKSVQPLRPGKHRIRNALLEDLRLSRGEHFSCHQRRELLADNTEHPLVVDEQDGPHVVEAAQADLAQHLRRQRMELVLMQLQPDLVDLFQSLPLAGDQVRRRRVLVGDAAEPVSTAALRVRQQSEVRGSYQPRCGAETTPDGVYKQVDIYSALLALEEVQGKVGTEEIEQPVEDLSLVSAPKPSRAVTAASGATNLCSIGGADQAMAPDAHVVQGLLPVRLVDEPVEGETGVDLGDSKVFHGSAVFRAAILDQKVRSPRAPTCVVALQGPLPHLTFQPLSHAR